MAGNCDPDLSIASVLRDLDAVRKRIDQAPGRFKDGEAVLSAAALATEAGRLCQQAAGSGDLRAAYQGLARARTHLRELEALLGLH